MASFKHHAEEDLGVPTGWVNSGQNLGQCAFSFIFSEKKGLVPHIHIFFTVASFFKSLVFKPSRVEESAIFLSAVINSGEPSFKAVAI